MIVYIEYVLIDNFVIDYLLIKATFILTGSPINKRRLFLCAFLGASCSLVYPMLQNLGLITTIIKILSGLLLVLIATEYKSIKHFYITAIIFFALTFFTGGVILGVFSIFDIENASEICVATIILPAYLVIKSINSIVKYFYSRKTVENFKYKVKLTMFSKSLILNGFLDTGNNLSDGDRIVIVFNKKIFTRLLGDNIRKVKLKQIEIITASGKSTNFAFELDKLELYFDNKINIYRNITVMISRLSLGADFDVILSPKLLESGYANQTDIIAKKTS